MLLFVLITKMSTSPQEISNTISIFVKSCDQNVSSFWSHDFLFLSFGIFEFRYININITTMEGLRHGKFENYPIIATDSCKESVNAKSWVSRAPDILVSSTGKVERVG